MNTIKDKNILWLLVVAIVAIFISYFYLGYSWHLASDSFEYGQAVHFVFHGGVITQETLMNRMLPSPLFVGASAILDLAVKNVSTSMAVVNIIFYLLLVPAFYLLSLEIYKDKKIAVFSSLLVVLNFYVIEPGNSHLADLGGWFFLIVSTYFALKYISNYQRKFYWWSVGLAVVGFFFKEYGGLGLLNLALLILISDLPWQQKWKDIILSGVIMLIPLIPFHLYMYHVFGVSYIGKFFFVKGQSLGPGYKSWYLFIKILCWLYAFGWIAWIYGMYKDRNMQRIKILLALFPSIMFWVIWPAITQRLAVIMLFWLAPISAFGMSKMKWYIAYAFLAVYILWNINLHVFLGHIPILSK